MDVQSGISMKRKTMQISQIKDLNLNVPCHSVLLSLLYSHIVPVLYANFVYGNHSVHVNEKQEREREREREREAASLVACTCGEISGFQISGQRRQVYKYYIELIYTLNVILIVKYKY
jgi:hypothetical protein